MFSGSVRGLNVPAVQENATFDTFIKNLLIDPTTVTQDVLDTINSLYPLNDPSLGAPFNTGDSLFDRAEAWYTDNMYLAARRLLFNKAAPLQPLFAYAFREFIPGNDPSLGGSFLPCIPEISTPNRAVFVVFHGSELELLFGHFPAVEQAFAKQMADFYVNFINDLNPGGILYNDYCPSSLCSHIRTSSLAAVYFADETGAPADEGQHYGYSRWYVV